MPSPPYQGNIPAHFFYAEQLRGVRHQRTTGTREELMRISCNFLALGILCLTSVLSKAQDVVPYAKSDVKVDWVRGTDFSKRKTYAWGTTSQMTPDPKHTIEGAIDAALQAKGLQKVDTDANPGLVVAFSAGNKPVYSIQGSLKNPIVKEGTLVVQLADPQLKKAVWWGIAEDALTDDPDKYVALIQKKISKMFQKYPPPTKK
jgi:hypothetical protein